MQRALHVKDSEHILNNKRIKNTLTVKTYPILNVTRDYKNHAVEIEYINTINNDTQNWIPVTYTTESSLSFTKNNIFFWLNSYERSHRIEMINIRDDWIIFNIQQIGE